MGMFFSFSTGIQNVKGPVSPLCNRGLGCNLYLYLTIGGKQHRALYMLSGGEVAACLFCVEGGAFSTVESIVVFALRVLTSTMERLQRQKAAISLFI